jgi:hypothetical protein
MQLNLFAPAAKVRASNIPWVGEYEVKKGQTRKFRYFRFYWCENNQTHHIHIPGGDVNHPKARDRKLQIEKLIDQGASVETICQLVRSWSTGRGGNLNRNRFLG